MSKCHVWELSKVFEALLADALYAYPALKHCFERDLKTVSRLVEQNGISVYTEMLPAVAKHLSRCLDDGQYKRSGLALTRGLPFRGPVPVFLRGLSLLVFDESGALKDDYDVQAVFFLRQLYSFAKKVQLPCSNDATEDEVLSFIDVDEQLPIPEKVWESDHATDLDFIGEYAGFQHSSLYKERILTAGNEDFRVSVDLSIVLQNLDIVSGFLNAALGPYRHEDWSFRHGPGAVSERIGKANKYYWSNWSDRLENVFPIADVGFHSYPAWAGRINQRGSVGSQDPQSRLVAVPKTLTGPRLIAAEPSEHQWCQQNIWHYFCRRTAVSWISKFVRFTDQTRNQELCIRGSRDGSLATLDLSSASDRVTCHSVGQLFRTNPPLLLALQATRTRTVMQGLSMKAPELHTLRKFSTMGSACTFPVQSLMFLSIALASCLTARKMRVTRENIESLSEEVAVFGDDIVIPTDSRELLVRCLEVLHFKVNMNKSYWTGRFRESCGVDAFGGVMVTPAYWRGLIDSDPQSIASLVSVSNNFQKRFLLNTAYQVASAIQSVPIPIVSMDSGVFGLKTFVAPKSYPGFTTRYNQALQRYETLLPSLSVTVLKSPIKDDSALLQYFTEDPSPFLPWKGGTAQRPKAKVRFEWVSEDSLSLK